MDQYQKFYKSVAWQLKREQILQRDCHQCQMCVARLEEAVRTGVQLRPRDRHIRRAVCVHHIKKPSKRRKRNWPRSCRRPQRPRPRQIWPSSSR